MSALLSILRYLVGNRQAEPLVTRIRNGADDPFDKCLHFRRQVLPAGVHEREGSKNSAHRGHDLNEGASRKVISDHHPRHLDQTESFQRAGDTRLGIRLARVIKT
jgi:hypothetical protein